MVSAHNKVCREWDTGICHKCSKRKKGRESGTGTRENGTHPPVRGDLWYPKVARLCPRPRVGSIPLRTGTCGGTPLLRVGDVICIRLAVLRVRECMGMWLQGAVGPRMLLVPLLCDDVLWVRELEIVCVTDGCLGILELELSRGHSVCGGEGGVGLLIRDDGHIIGGKPSALLTEQTVPPS
jgi:hypothetical protein